MQPDEIHHTSSIWAKLILGFRRKLVFGFGRNRFEGLKLLTETLMFKKFSAKLNLFDYFCKKHH